jgi:plasmid stabilization system protein ParE
MNLEFHPEAAAEFEAAADFYHSRQPGLERRFLDSVERCTTKIKAAPQRFRKFDGEIRRALVSVFPYAILFSVSPDRIFVLAVMHCSREPGYWRNRQ